MNATFNQLNSIENINKNFGIEFLRYGHYSNGDIAVLCKDEFSEFSISVDRYGNTN